MTLEFTIQQFLIFNLVLARVVGLMLVAPGFGSQSLPMQVRGFLALSLALLITPLQTNSEIPEVGNLPVLVQVIAGELLVGVIMGFCISLVFTTAQLAGQIMGQMSGMQMADVYNPNLGTTIPLFAQLLDMMMLTAFVLIGGHRMVIAAFLDVYSAIPIGHSPSDRSVMELIVHLLTQSFILGIKVSAPIMVALALAVLVLGIISRTLPQINAMQVGFPLNAILLSVVIFYTTTSTWTIFEKNIEQTVTVVRDAVIRSGEVSPQTN